MLSSITAAEVTTEAKWFPDGKGLVVCGSEVGKAPAASCRARPTARRSSSPPNTNLAVVSPDGESLFVRSGDSGQIHRLTGGAPITFPN